MLTVVCNAGYGVGIGSYCTSGGVVPECGAGGAFAGYVLVATGWEGRASWEWGAGDEGWKEREESCIPKEEHFDRGDYRVQNEI